MTEEALKARREYYKNWRKKNPHKDKEYHERYWSKKAQEGQETAAAEENISADPTTEGGI